MRSFFLNFERTGYRSPKRSGMTIGMYPSLTSSVTRLGLANAPLRFASQPRSQPRHLSQIRDYLRRGDLNHVGERRPEVPRSRTRPSARLDRQSAGGSGFEGVI